MIAADLLFHSFTSPFASMPKIGALAVSMKVCSSCATRVFSTSTCFRSVMSWPTPIIPTTAPQTSQRGVEKHLNTLAIFCVQRKLEVGGLAALQCIVEHLLDADLVLLSDEILRPAIL